MKKRFFITGIAAFLMISLASIQINAQNTDTTNTENHNTYKPGDHELLIGPTATTMPKGTWYFTSYELLLLNVGYSFTDDFQVGVFSLFPMTSDFVETVSLGAKYRLFENDNFSVGATSAILFEVGVYNVGAVTTYRNNKLTLNANVSYSGKGGEDGGITVIPGIQYEMSDRFSLLGEYVSLSGTRDITDNVSFFFIGGRWIADKMSFDFGGFRPTDGGGELLLIPYIKGTIIF